MKLPLVLTVVGGVLLAMSVLVLVVSLLLPILNAGKASWNEAMMGIIPGAGCSCTSFLILMGGIIWLLVTKSKN